MYTDTDTSRGNKDKDKAGRMDGWMDRWIDGLVLTMKCHIGELKVG